MTDSKNGSIRERRVPQQADRADFGNDAATDEVYAHHRGPLVVAMLAVLAVFGLWSACFR